SASLFNAGTVAVAAKSEPRKRRRVVMEPRESRRMRLGNKGKLPARPEPDGECVAAADLEAGERAYRCEPVGHRVAEVLEGIEQRAERGQVCGRQRLATRIDPQRGGGIAADRSHRV